MNPSGFVSVNSNCGFFDIRSIESFEIVNPSAQLDRVLGRDTAGISYIDLVCPEDKEAVADSLSEVYLAGQSDNKEKRPGRCIRHRILTPDDKAVNVSLTFGYDDKGFLVCSVIRASDDIGGDSESKYHSNSVIEAFAISMAVVYINSEQLIAVKFANDDFYRMIGWNRLEFNDYFNECISDVIIHPDDFQALHLTLASTDAEHPESVIEIRVLRMNGEVRINEVRTRFLEMENERALISLVFADITEFKRLRKELMIKNERFNILQNNSDQTIFDYDTENDVCMLSGSVSRIEKYLSVFSFHHGSNEVAIEDFFGGRYPLNIMSKEDYEKLCDVFASAIVDGKDGEFEFEAWVLGQNAGTWFKCAYNPVKDDSGSVIRIVGRLKNIDKQKKAEQLMEKRMKSDMLTGLLNKETAKSQIRQFLSSQSQSRTDDDKYHVLLIIDLDDFHLINECFGHTFGDNVLKEFASDIKSSFRDSDIVSRLVGDRFMVLMKNVTQKFAVKKAGRLCRSLIKSYGVQTTVTISCSIGVAFFGKDASDFDELYQYADQAAYEAKKNGKCAYNIYDSELEEDYSRVKEITGNVGPDPVPTVTDVSELDINLMDIAFSLLSTSDDMYGALDILLRTTGKKYNLSTVSLYIKGYEKGDKLKTVCRWISNRNLSTRDGRSPLIANHVDLESELGTSGIRCVSDVSTSNLHPALKNMLKNDGMISMVFCGLEGRAGGYFGYLVFNQFDRKRKWSQKETSTFRYLAKIVSMALSEKYEARQIAAKGIEDYPVRALPQ